MILGPNVNQVLFSIIDIIYLYQVCSSLQSLDITTFNTGLCSKDLPFLGSHSQEHAMALKYDTLTLEYYSQISIKFKRSSSLVDVPSPRR